jgi:hypothetical protein
MDIKTKINPHLFRGNITKQFDEEHDISNGLVQNPFIFTLK